MLFLGPAVRCPSSLVVSCVQTDLSFHDGILTVVMPLSLRSLVSKYVTIKHTENSPLRVGYRSACRSW